MNRTVYMITGATIVLCGLFLLFFYTTPFSQQTQQTASSTPLFKTVMTTEFWVGEPSDASNNFIPNNISYWDEYWQTHYGGVDSGENRCGYIPCAFKPKENPFYFALPYGEFNTQTGALKANAKEIPWYTAPTNPKISIVKNTWIEVTHQDHTCYGQWEDVGPNNEDDFSYVFGSSSPTNTFGAHAGLDVSPALWTCLSMEDNASTSWRFVDISEIPAGPWRDIITTSTVTWK